MCIVEDMYSTNGSLLTYWKFILTLWLYLEEFLYPDRVRKGEIGMIEQTTS